MITTLDQWIACERERSRLLCEAAGVTYPGDQFVARAGKNLPELNPNWRFVPEGINQVAGLTAWQSLGGKLYGGSLEMASEKGRDDFTTRSSLILSPLFLRADLDGRPFGLNKAEQVAWAVEQGGGEGLTYVPETLFLWGRCAIEEQRLLWPYGAARCADIFDSAFSFYVSFSQTGGLGVYWCDDDVTSDSLAAVARKVIVLGS